MLDDNSEDVDSRPRGIFSSTDREYLRDPETYGADKSRQAVMERKEEIRKRIRHALLDFEILADPDVSGELVKESLQNQEVTKSPLSKPVDERPLDPAIEYNFVNMISFIYRSISRDRFNAIVEEGVKAAVRRYYPDYEVIDASYQPEIQNRERAHEQAKDRLEKGVYLTAEQIQLLLVRGEVEPERVAEHVRKQHSNQVEMVERFHEELPEGHQTEMIIKRYLEERGWEGSWEGGWEVGE